MNKQTITLQDLDDFFNEAIEGIHLESQSDIEQTTSDSAWQAAQAFQRNLIEFGLYEETLYLKAAATQEELEMPFQLDSIGGEWSITREIIPGDDEWQILKFRCLRTEKFMAIYEQRQITAEIGGVEYDLGEVFECVAQVNIPRNIDISQGIHIKIKEKT